ncbi:MAG: terminase family protein [Rhodospirillales bacterium]
METINHLQSLPSSQVAAAVGALSRADRERFLIAAQERLRRHGQREFYRLFPSKGAYRRQLYPRHMEFFAAGSDYRERCFLAANRVGKTVGGGYEISCHLTGLYPKWWPGRRFDRPTKCWSAGKTNETTRDIIQAKLLGSVQPRGSEKWMDGTGIIPGEMLTKRPAWKSGVADLVDTIKVKHVSGGYSTLGLKSYQQGRGSFEGTEQDVIWLDEECPEDVYGECLIRTATTDGLVMLTFTPLMGLTQVVLQFLPDEMNPGAAAA